MTPLHVVQEDLEHEVHDEREDEDEAEDEAMRMRLRAHRHLPLVVVDTAVVVYVPVHRVLHRGVLSLKRRFRNQCR